MTSLLSDFKVRPGFDAGFSWQGFDEAHSGLVNFESLSGGDAGLNWPTSRDTINHDTISYAGMKDSHEVVDLYLLAYQFSMLSRYFPDLWVGCIESQCRAARIVERVSSIIAKKLPILMLSIIRGEEIVISTHRPPWRG